MDDDTYRKVRVQALLVMARGICRSYDRANGCFCSGEIRRCHAPILYNDFAIAALLELERCGFAVIQLPTFDMKGAMAEAVATLNATAEAGP